MMPFRYAGYHSGQSGIPTPPVSKDFVADFGGIADGKTDNSAALNAALSTMYGGVLYFPPGT